MSKHSPDDIGYKQMFLINKFEKDIMENSLSKMREPKNISNESSNPIKNISKSSQTEEVINESKDDVNLIERKNKDENKMICFHNKIILASDSSFLKHTRQSWK